MSDKQVKVAKPEKVKPASTKPVPVKPENVKPVKAHGDYNHKHCVRCDKAITEASGVVRWLCSSCDLDLQTMHWQTEHILFNKTTYMPEQFDGSFSTFSPPYAWFLANGYKDDLKKPPPPKRRNYFRAPPKRSETALIM